MFEFGKVSYVNVLPLFCAGAPDFLKVEAAVPSFLNESVAAEKFDAATVSRWTYTKSVARDYCVLPNFCVAGDGDIMSVKLFSKIPVEELGRGRIYITSESGSSIRAFALLCKKKYGFEFFKRACENVETADAVFLIGDAALAFDSARYPYVYDFGAMWKDFAKVPMIYAIVVVRRGLESVLSRRLSEFFDLSLSEFFSNPAKYFPVAREMFLKSGKKNISDEVLRDYYNRLIFKLDTDTFSKAFKFADDNAEL